MVLHVENEVVNDRQNGLLEHVSSYVDCLKFPKTFQALLELDRQYLSEKVFRFSIDQRFQSSALALILVLLNNEHSQRLQQTFHCHFVTGLLEGRDNESLALFKKSFVKLGHKLRYSVKGVLTDRVLLMCEQSQDTEQ